MTVSEAPFNPASSQVALPTGRREGLDWHEVETYARCFPQYAEDARRLIANFISYLPEPLIYMPHEVAIRALFANYQQGNLSEDECFTEIEFCAKQIRNDDMKKHGWVEKREFNDDDYAYYKSHLPQFTQAAKDRLKRFLDYEPPLKHALSAEIYLRQLFTMDEYYPEMPSCSIDHRAVTIFTYREALVQYGLEAADNSSLVGAAMCEQTGSPKTSLLLYSIYDY